MSKAREKSTRQDLNAAEQTQGAPNMKRMWELAFTQKALAVSSCGLAVISTLVSFVPFIAIYYIICELALNMNNPGSLDAGYIAGLGGLAGGSAVAAILLNFIALMCSHMAAFKTLYLLNVISIAIVSAMLVVYDWRSCILLLVR